MHRLFGKEWAKALYALLGSLLVGVVILGFLAGKITHTFLALVVIVGISVSFYALLSLWEWANTKSRGSNNEDK